MNKVLWIGDAVVSTGFARCTHHILEEVRKTWDVHVLGINYKGDPHDLPYAVYPCWPGGDAFGVRRTKSLIEKVMPNLVVVQNDLWNVPGYLEQSGSLPVMATMPVDGKNCQGRKVNGLSMAVFWTQFGLKEAQEGGYTGKAAVLPLGVDLNVYKPGEESKAELRKRLGLPKNVQNGFIVGTVNRNQPRKRLDLTVAYFADWVHRNNIDDAYLMLHVAPTGDMGYDLGQLMHYYKLANRVILVQPEIGFGYKESSLVNVYGMMDVQVSTTQGEGWGLTTMEGMACGIPQIVPDWAALGEWCEDAVVKVPITEISVTPNNINAVGGIAGREQFIQELQAMYEDKDRRENYSRMGLELVQRDCYRWPVIGQRFGELMCEALHVHHMKGVR